MQAPPSRATLAKYGLSERAWKALYEAQEGRCGVCSRKVDRLVVDHEHRRGWAKMAPARRALFVRALLCARCNWRYLPAGLNLDIARGVVRVLEAYEKRRPE